MTERVMTRHRKTSGGDGHSVVHATLVVCFAVLVWVGGDVTVGCAALEPWSQYGPGHDAGYDARADLKCAQIFDAGTMAEDLCEACCETNHPAWAGKYNALFLACVCTAATCGQPCMKSDCSDDAGCSVSGDPCDLCES